VAVHQSGRNSIALSQNEIADCLLRWQVLLDAQEQRFAVDIKLDSSRATTSYTTTVFDEESNTVRLGADVRPGVGPDANSRLSVQACLAHELAHAQRFKLGFRRPTAVPDLHLDEAETSIAAAFMTPLTDVEREDLVEDARSRLSLWITQRTYGL
jgi:hypothetical protein